MKHRHDCAGGEACACPPAVLYDMGYEIWDALVVAHTEDDGGYDGPTNAGITHNVVTFDMKGKTWEVTINEKGR